MPKLIVLYWRDIPSQIIVKQGRVAAKRILSGRFQEAIDLAAMKSKAHQNNEYLTEWRRSNPISVEGRLEDEAQKALKKLEHDYNEQRLNLLVSGGGYDQS